MVDVASTENDVLRLERGDQTADDVLDVAPPLREPVRLQPVQSDVPLESSIPIRQVAQLHRLHDALDDEGRAQAGPQAEEEHLSALVAAQRLHRRIIVDLDRASEAFR